MTMGKLIEPKITLITWTKDPVKAIASQVMNMSGEMVHNLNEIPESRAEAILQELKKTGLGGALEMLDLVFQIENVPRSFTHQLVRNRVGATYHQESLRFTDRIGGFDYDIGEDILKNPEATVEFKDAMNMIAQAYDTIKGMDISTQDARGVLPIAIATKVGFKVNFKTLIHMSHVRLCHQSQPHWFKIMKMMKQEIIDKIDPVLGEFLVAACEATGRCEYKAIFDRKCPKEKVLIHKYCLDCENVDICGLNKGKDPVYCGAMKNLMRL